MNANTRAAMTNDVREARIARLYEDAEGKRRANSHNTEMRMYYQGKAEAFAAARALLRA